MNRLSTARRPQRERGVVLVIGLVILLVLSLLAIGSMRSTSLEERMTNNAQDQQIAFQIAEAALREGEAILQQPTLADFRAVGEAGVQAGMYKINPLANPDPPLWKIAAGASGAPTWRNAAVTSGAPPAPIGRARAQFMIEELSCLNLCDGSPSRSLAADGEPGSVDRRVFRITARAWGATAADQAAPMVMLQSTFKR